MYKLARNSTSIIRIADNAMIPNDSTNSDYKAYLDWIGKGNTVFVADAPSIAEINAPILAQLIDIDLKSIRALRENDAAKISDLNNQASTLRIKLIK